jgi:hydroxymethylpyrimidine pyrophosphatase-like HAD family hydrolase
MEIATPAPAKPVAPRRIAVDFDETIADTTFPTIHGIKEGAKEALTLFRNLGFKIVVWSCRTCHWDYDVYGGDRSTHPLDRDRVKDMIAFLDANGVPYDEIDDGSKGKPGADYYIDDKGIRFENNWQNIAGFVFTREMGLKLTPDQVGTLEEIANANGSLITFEGKNILLGGKL